ncbi:ParB N-terminal domain-containing protein [Neorhizobium galegae]|uniref:ParB N-terminal domain-containing protein n=1 Tax=Neorhizobium galegae TaxID=399 RepID=UPI0021007664|nr:ParB N-terminal domain-containing protein [Neorhizobium galegae]MCQ1574621.1 ParB N-terminal domain-containing protein [Neorhizobium galegae]
MTKETTDKAWKYIDIIPIDRIRILNPRERDKRKFRLLVENISKVGLKRPITVSKRSTGENETNYDLVCGQGRIEAFVALGQTHIPAMVIEASKNDRPRSSGPRYAILPGKRGSGGHGVAE